jgi:hypothetical protein
VSTYRYCPTNHAATLCCNLSCVGHSVIEWLANKVHSCKRLHIPCYVHHTTEAVQRLYGNLRSSDKGTARKHRGFTPCPPTWRVTTPPRSMCTTRHPNRVNLRATCCALATTKTNAPTCSSSSRRWAPSTRQACRYLRQEQPPGPVCINDDGKIGCWRRMKPLCDSAGTRAVTIAAACIVKSVARAIRVPGAR